MTLTTGAAFAQTGSKSEVTFSKDIAPIVQRACQRCHRPDGLAPMSLITYADVRPFARGIKDKVVRRQMPPWYIDKRIGLQKFKDDPSLSDEEIATIARWVDAGAPQGNPADMPAPVAFTDGKEWSIGKPDLIVESQSFVVKAVAPDGAQAGRLEPVSFGLTEDRYVSAVETKEVNDMPKNVKAATVGGRSVVHHANLRIVQPAGVPGKAEDMFPTHELGRNADIFPPDAGMLLRAGSKLSFGTHLHSNGRDTTAKIVVGMKLFPKGQIPKHTVLNIAPGSAENIDVNGNEANQRGEAYHILRAPTKLLTFEPHMHAAGVRQCLEAIWGPIIQTLNCAGYDHNWVRNYVYDDDSAPLLPKGTVLHVVGWFDTTPANPNVIDYRNWSGFGYRSIDQMLLNLPQAVELTEEEFQAEVAKREQKIREGKGEDLGCLPCGAAKTVAKGN